MVSRHIKYIIMITVTFSLYVINVVAKDVFHDSTNKTFSLIAANLLASQGIWLSILRLSEPAVWKVIKTKLPDWWPCCRQGREEAKRTAEENGTLASFLATSFNVELVYIILKGITKFSKEKKKIDAGEKQPKDSKIKRRIAKSTLTLNHIEIDDPSLWDVIKAEDFISEDGTEATGELMHKKKEEARAAAKQRGADDVLGIKQRIE